jgi:hypothetical protein
MEQVVRVEQLDELTRARAIDSATVTAWPWLRW